MFTKSEALIITAAVALAMLPKVESKVHQFTSQHRTEIQMAMNELEGKPAIPFVAPEVAPPAVPSFELASSEAPMAMPPAAAMRIEMARIRPAMAAARAARLQIATLRPQMAQLATLRVLEAQNRAAFAVYRLNVKRCPKAPAAPAVPASESMVVETGSLP